MALRLADHRADGGAFGRTNDQARLRRIFAAFTAANPIRPLRARRLVRARKCIGINCCTETIDASFFEQESCGN